MGYLKDATGNFSAGLLVLAGCTLAGGLVAMTLKVSRHLETVEPTQLAPAA
jgi:cyanate permease